MSPIKPKRIEIIEMACVHPSNGNTETICQQIRSKLDYMFKVIVSESFNLPFEISFEEIYRDIYNLWISNNHVFVKKICFEYIRQIKTLEPSKQKIMNLVFKDLFMYPIRVDKIFALEFESVLDNSTNAKFSLLEIRARHILTKGYQKENFELCIKLVYELCQSQHHQRVADIYKNLVLSTEIYKENAEHIDDIFAYLRRTKPSSIFEQEHFESSS